MPKNLDDFLERKKAGGKVKSSGLFTISLRAAKRKLATSRLPKPSFWLLKIVQAAVASGAQAVKISLLQSKTRVSFGGPGHGLGDPGEVANDLFELGEGRSRAHRHLMVGLSAASGLEHFYQIVWQDPRYEQQLEASHKRVQVKASKAQQFCLTVERRAGWFGIPEGRAEEQQAILERCKHLSAPLYFEGQDITCGHLCKRDAGGVIAVESHQRGSKQMRFPSPGASYRKDGDRLIWEPKPGDPRLNGSSPPCVYHFSAGLPRMTDALTSESVVVLSEKASSGQLIVLRDGVELDPVMIPHPGFTVYLSEWRLRVDASEFGVVENREFEDLRERVNSLVKQAVDAIDNTSIDRLFRYRIQALQAAGKHSALQAMCKRQSSLEKRLSQLKSKHF